MIGKQSLEPSGETMRVGSSLFRVGSLKEIVWQVSLSSSLKHCLFMEKVWERTGKARFLVVDVTVFLLAVVVNFKL